MSGVQWALLAGVLGLALAATVSGKGPASPLWFCTLLCCLAMSRRIWNPRSGAWSLIGQIAAMLAMVQSASDVQVVGVTVANLIVLAVAPWCLTVTEIHRRAVRHQVRLTGRQETMRDHRRLRTLATTWNRLRIRADEPGCRLRWVTSATPVYGRTHVMLTDTRTYATSHEWVRGTWPTSTWLLIGPDGIVVASCTDDARAAWEQLDAVRRAAV